MSNAQADHVKDMIQSVKTLCQCDKECGGDVPANVLECEGVVKCLLGKCEEQKAMLKELS